MVMLSVSYAGKTEYGAGITDALLRVDTSGANTCYMLVQCVPPVQGLTRPNFDGRDRDRD